MIGVRIRDGEFEGQCDYCREFLPLAPEFWPMKQSAGLRRCRACLAEYHRLRERGYRAAKRDVIRAAARARYRMLPPEELARRREQRRLWRVAHPEYTRAYNAAYRARRRDEKAAA